MSDAYKASYCKLLYQTLHDFDLSADEFGDSLTIRYYRPLIMSPANCDEYGEVFSLTRALKWWTCDPESQCMKSGCNR